MTPILLTLICGCMDQSEIRTYTIPSGAEPMTTDRLRPLYVQRTAARPQLPEFKLPEEWRSAAADEFSAAAFAAGPDDRPVRITVTQMPAAMGLAVQLNRWRGQIGLEKLDDADLENEITPLSMGPVEAAFVSFNGPGGESIAGAVAVNAGQMWFFKMRGADETVKEELARLKEFCQSVRFD